MAGWARPAGRINQLKANRPWRGLPVTTSVVDRPPSVAGVYHHVQLTHEAGGAMEVGANNDREPVQAEILCCQYRSALRDHHYDCKVAYFVFETGTTEFTIPNLRSSARCQANCNRHPHSLVAGITFNITAGMARHLLKTRRRLPPANLFRKSSTFLFTEGCLLLPAL